jgi:hypothetical protein
MAARLCTVMQRATLCLCFAAAGPLAAAGADPLKTPACLQALAGLQQLERAALSSPGRPTESAADKQAALQAVKAQQRRTALACQLDTAAPGPALASRIREPVRVSPLVLPSAVPLRRPPPPTSPGVEPGPRAVTLGACDEQGCWTSDGRRLSRAGSLLVGPSGYCSQQGPVLLCP